MTLYQNGERSSHILLHKKFHTSRAPSEEVAGCREGGSIELEHMQCPEYAREVQWRQRYPAAVVAMSGELAGSGRCA